MLSRSAASSFPFFVIYPLPFCPESSHDFLDETVIITTVHSLREPG